MTRPRSGILLLPEAMAWALTSAGWLGLTGLGQWLAPFQVAAYWPLAAYLLIGGLAAQRLQRRQAYPASPALRPALLAALFVALAALIWTTSSLALAVLAGGLWALLGIAASSTDRRAPGRSAGWAAMAGAVLGGVLLGGRMDGPSILVALAILSLLAAGLAVLAKAPRGAYAHLGCGFPAACGLGPGHWPEAAATLAMIPMMTALPAMAGRCASDALPVQAMVGAHLVAMFLPALLLASVTGPLAPARVRLLAGLLMVAGALPLAVGVADATYGVLVVTLCQGAAWGVVWLSRRQAGAEATGGLPAAVLPGALASATGVVTTADSLNGFDNIHLALGVLAGAGLPWLGWRRGGGLQTMAR